VKKIFLIIVALILSTCTCFANYFDDLSDDYEPIIPSYGWSGGVYIKNDTIQSVIYNPPYYEISFDEISVSPSRGVIFVSQETFHLWYNTQIAKVSTAHVNTYDMQGNRINSEDEPSNLSFVPSGMGKAVDYVFYKVYNMPFYRPPQWRPYGNGMYEQTNDYKPTKQ